MKKITRSIRNNSVSIFTLVLIITIALSIIILRHINSMFYLTIIPFITYYINKIIYIKLFEIYY